LCHAINGMYPKRRHERPEQQPKRRHPFGKITLEDRLTRGVGRVGGMESIRFMTQIKSVVLDIRDPDGD